MPRRITVTRTLSSVVLGNNSFRIQTPQKLLFQEIGIVLLTQSISEVASLGELQTIEILS